MLSLVMKTFKALILLEKINLNYLVKDNKNVIKIVIISHRIEQLIK